VTSIPERWADQSRYDLETASAMLESGRWLYVLFCCQQAAEKMIKSVIAERTNEVPPRLHNLMRLAEHAGLEPDEATAQKLRLLAAYYIESRYPDEVDALSRQCDRNLAVEVLQQTREVLTWLESQRRS
jgi:HEPN domain-containing protein